ncbi:MAG: tRNA (guanosine(46)-N7)-methyltransferase TrmB, partial [Succinivibrio sp.]
REAPLVVEIGFGMGVSFVEMAKNDPLSNYLGIEVHPPGVGSCLKLIEENGVSNVRIIQHDAFEILSKYLKPESVDILQIFFPDPWPKKRHIKRRLINEAFVDLVRPLFKHGGQFRMATDWENYAEQMLEVMTNAQGFSNTSADGTYIERPSWRPLTKFELRGQRLGHGVWDLVFKRD